LNLDLILDKNLQDENNRPYFVCSGFASHFKPD
jgi:hypothetical protein